MMRFCCHGFEHHSLNVGKKGLSVYAKKHGDGPLFQLEYRGVEIDLQQGLTEALENIPKVDPPFDFVIAAPIVIGFCPWCGRKLEKTYRHTWQELVFSQGVAVDDE